MNIFVTKKLGFDRFNMMLRSILMSALQFLIIKADYCNIPNCGNSHTLCQYSTPGPSQICGNVISYGLRDDEKDTIVNLHNQLRQKVASGQELRGNPGPQPAARNMPNLIWDSEIATVAQRWADQCTFQHDSCRDVERFYVGQNLVYIGTTKNVNDITAESLVNMWYNEVKNFSRNAIASFGTSGADLEEAVRHYTQFVWAKSTYIGCGGMKYNKDGFNNFYLVCNYGEGGNIIDQPIYEAV